MDPEYVQNGLTGSATVNRLEDDQFQGVVELTLEDANGPHTVSFSLKCARELGCALIVRADPELEIARLPVDPSVSPI